MLQPGQLRVIHVAARQVRLIAGGGKTLDDGRYRMLLRSVGGVESSKDLNNVTLEDCMAVLEGMGFDQRLDKELRAKLIARVTVLANKQDRCIPALCEEISGRDSDSGGGGGGVVLTLEELSYGEWWMLAQELGFYLDHRPSTYWRGKVDRRSMVCNERMVRKIRELAPQQRYELPAMCLRMSRDRTDDEEQLTPREAWNLIEMLKNAGAREVKVAAAPAPPATVTKASDLFSDCPF